MPSTQGSIDRTSLNSIVDSIKSGSKRRGDFLDYVVKDAQDKMPSRPKKLLGLPVGDYRKRLAGHSDRTEWITKDMSDAEKEEVANRNAKALEIINRQDKTPLEDVDTAWGEMESGLPAILDERLRVKRMKDYCGRTFLTNISKTDWAGLSASQRYEVDQLSVRFSTPTAKSATATDYMFLRLKSTGNNPSAEGASLDCNTTAPSSVQQPKSISVEFDMRRIGQNWEVDKATPSAWPGGVPEPDTTSQGWITLDTSKVTTPRMADFKS